MQLTDAQTAALPSLLAELAGLQQVVAVIQSLVSDPTATITGGPSVSSAQMGNANLPLPAMSAAESAPFFALALSTFQARLMAAQAQLAAL